MMWVRHAVWGMATVSLAALLASCGGGGAPGIGDAAQGTLLVEGPSSGGNTGGNSSPSEKPSDPGTTPQNPPPQDPPPQDPPPQDPPPQDPPPDPTVACRTLSQCLNGAQASVTSFKGGKKAAASYTFDDGYDSDFAVADMFESRGLRASFYIVVSGMHSDDARWALWKNVMQRGHEVGNHSMTHSIDLGAPDLTEVTMTTEILNAQNIIADKLGVKPLVFAFPWHSSTAASRAFALKTHLAIRTSTDDLPFTLAFFDAAHGTPQETLATVNGQLANTVAAGGWYVAAGHGLDGDGWSPISNQFLNDHLDYMQQTFGSKLWVDTFLNVARYQICRKQASVQVDPVSSTQASIKLSGSFNPACTEPLTVAIPVLVSGMPAVVARDANGGQLALKKVNGALTLDVVPGQTVTLTAGQ